MYPLTKFGIILTAVALTCWPAPILAGPTVPDKGSIEGIVTKLVLITPNATTIYQEYTGSGKSIILGPFTVTGSQFVTFRTPQTVFLAGAVNGSLTYTLGDGSTLTGSYSGTLTHPPGGFAVFTVQVQFGQGTGQLAGVTGRATARILTTGPFPGNPFTGASIGTLTFP